jgi:hypothetical protein
MQKMEVVIFDLERDGQIHPRLRFTEEVLEDLVSKFKETTDRIGAFLLSRQFDLSKPIGRVIEIRREGNKLLAKIESTEDVFKRGRFAIGVLTEQDKEKGTILGWHSISWIAR